MIRKSVIASLAVALLLGGGGYFSLNDGSTGCVFAATSQPYSPTTTASRRGPSQGSARMHRQSSSYGSVNVMTVSKSTMESKMTNTSRYAVYVGQGSSYTEYWSTASDADKAARDIIHRVSYGYFQTSNSRLYYSMMRQGSFSSDGTYSNHGNTVYCFRH